MEIGPRGKSACLDMPLGRAAEEGEVNVTQKVKGPGAKASDELRPLNRLKSIYALRATLDKAYKETVEAQKGGKPIAWSMFNASYEPSFLNTMEMESVFPENYSSLAASLGEAVPLEERSATEGFPTHLCGYAQACLGYSALMAEAGGQIPAQAPAGGMPKPSLLIGSSYVCDARFKWFQAMGRYLDTPLWVFEVPDFGLNEAWTTDSYEQDIQMLMKELREFAAFLERLLGRKMDWDKFDQDTLATIQMHDVWYEVNELRKARPCPMHSRDFWASTFASFFRATDPALVRDLYLQELAEVKERVAHKVSGINRPEKYRILVDGLPPWQNLGIFEPLAERGWNCVYEMLYHPLRPIDLSGIRDPIERLARYAHRRPQDIFDDLTPEEDARIQADIKKTGYCRDLLEGGKFYKRILSNRLPRDYQVDGVFLHIPRTCRAVAAGMRTREQDFMKMWSVPSLSIEGDHIDSRLFDAEDILRKAEAFEETMDHYRQVRKEQGLEW
jgi:benzoyl-CoA reductase/2-hydroxyglutaryl-CoA dehydratase subunit BcrC/BadD/HgdB